MNVLIDYHHPQLFESLRILFEDRLGHKVFRPKGRDWYEKGYFNYYQNQEISFSFLDNLEGISLQDASSIKFDLVISTIPLTEDCFLRFIKDRQPKAKHVVVVGNVSYEPEFDNIMSSTSFFGKHKNVFFHQEFDLNLFNKTPILATKIVSSFLSFPSSYLDYQMWSQLSGIISDFELREYGFLAKHGYLSGEVENANKLKETAWVWHVKHTGEGYGHVVHKAASIGRPLIIRGSHFRGMLIEKYLIHRKTCIDLDKCESLDVFAHLLRVHSFKDELTKMNDNINKIFKDNVNFEKDALKVKEFIESL